MKAITFLLIFTSIKLIRVYNNANLYNADDETTDHASLKVFDITGKKVAALGNEVQDSGMHPVIADAGDLSSGAYFYELKSNGMTRVKGLMVVK